MNSKNSVGECVLPGPCSPCPATTNGYKASKSAWDHSIPPTRRKRRRERSRAAAALRRRGGDESRTNWKRESMGQIRYGRKGAKAEKSTKIKYI